MAFGESGAALEFLLSVSGWVLLRKGVAVGRRLLGSVVAMKIENLDSGWLRFSVYLVLHAIYCSFWNSGMSHVSLKYSVLLSLTLRTSKDLTWALASL
jgi:hypothetical protein